MNDYSLHFSSKAAGAMAALVKRSDVRFTVGVARFYMALKGIDERLQAANFIASYLSTCKGIRKLEDMTEPQALYEEIRTVMGRSTPEETSKTAMMTYTKSFFDIVFGMSRAPTAHVAAAPQAPLASGAALIGRSEPAYREAVRRWYEKQNPLRGAMVCDMIAASLQAQGIDRLDDIHKPTATYRLVKAHIISEVQAPKLQALAIRDAFRFFQSVVNMRASAPMRAAIDIAVSASRPKAGVPQTKPKTPHSGSKPSPL